MSESTSTALAHVADPASGTALDQIRNQGRAAVEKRKELNKLSRMMEGLEWGNVKGRTLSEHTRYALAEFCYITRANPQLHIDVLGGKPYLNAQYWSDLLNADEHYIGYDQSNISKSVSDLLRAQSEEALKDAERFGDEDARKEAARLRAEAREIERRRREWGAPDDTSEVYETVIHRYAPRAPIDKIVAGEIDGAAFIQEVRECNWAGNRPNDPVGKAEAAKTARTRSFRRAAVKGFSAWLERRDEEIRAAEKIVEAEFRIIEDDEAAAGAALPSPTGAQAMRAGVGEPEAANASGARPLPVEGEGAQAQPAPTPEPTPAPSPEPEWDKNDARKKLFATLRDAGIEGDPARKKWAKENDLPESTKEWGRAEFDRAIEILVAPERKRFIEGCEVIGADPETFAAEHLTVYPEGERTPTLLRDFKFLTAILVRMADDDAEPELGL